MKVIRGLAVGVVALSLLGEVVLAQPPEGRGPRGEQGEREPGERGEGGRRGGFGRGFGGPEGGGGPGRMMAMFPIMQALDKDEDGTLSSEEIDNAVAALKALDKNEDGKLTMEELMPMRGEGGFGGPGGPGGFGGPAGPGGGPEAMVARLMENDANGDGKLSQEELPERMAARMMERADEDGDGFLSKEEIEKSIPAGRGGFGRGGRGAGRAEGEGAPEGRRRPRRPE